MAGPPRMWRRLRHFLGKARPIDPAPAPDPRHAQIRAGTLFDVREVPARPRHHNEAIIRSLCYNAYLGRDTALCRVLGRYQMFVDTTDVGLSSHLLTHGFWEMWHTEAMIQLVMPGMTAVDVGANLGYFTVLMADLVGGGGRVHAVEPNPALAARMRNTVDVNGFGPRVTIHETALGDTAGRFTLIVPEGEPKNAHVAPLARAAAGLEIAAERFDAIPELMSADIIKIDVEGAEQKVWRGMRGLLDSGRSVTIILEFTLKRYKDPNAFIDELSRHGFSFSVIDPSRGIVPTDRDRMLAHASGEDQLLILRR